jgi:predicted amidophosphoribosyltransferase
LLKDTCKLSSEIKGRDILLVDDIYTPGCGIDEDAIQALYDAGARSVIFYAVGYTAKKTSGYRYCA